MDSCSETLIFPKPDHPKPNANISRRPLDPPEVVASDDDEKQSDRSFTGLGVLGLPDVWGGIDSPSHLALSPQ
jgi:hypothetical protein